MRCQSLQSRNQQFPLENKFFWQTVVQLKEQFILPEEFPLPFRGIKFVQLIPAFA